MTEQPNTDRTAERERVEKRAAAVNAFANRVARYVTEEGDDTWSTYRCAVEAVTVTMQDAWHEVEAIGAPVGTPEPPSDPRLALAQATNQRGWHFAPTADIVHFAEDCNCEQADAWTMEMDPRCGTGPEHTAVTLDDGAYTQWVINLDAFAAAVEQTRDWDDTAEAILVTKDGPCIPLADADAVLALFSQPRPEHTIEDYGRAYWAAMTDPGDPNWADLPKRTRAKVSGCARAVLDLAGVPVADPEPQHEPAWKIGDRVEHTILGIGEVIEHRPHLKNLPYLIRFGDGQGWFEAGDIQEAPPEPQRPEWVRLTEPCGGWTSGASCEVEAWTEVDRNPVIYDTTGSACIVTSWEPADPPPPEPEPCVWCDHPADQHDRRGCDSCACAASAIKRWDAPVADPPVVPAPPTEPSHALAASRHAEYADWWLVSCRTCGERTTVDGMNSHFLAQLSEWHSAMVAAAASPTVLVELSREDARRWVNNAYEPHRDRANRLRAACRDALAAKEDQP